MTWHRRAMCRNHPEDLWTSDTASPTQTAAAKAICSVCPVRQPCLETALTLEPAGERYGIFGGYGPAERDRLARGETVPIIHGNMKHDPADAHRLVAEYVAEHGRRYGALNHAAAQLGVHPNTVAAYLRRGAA